MPLWSKKLIKCQSSHTLANRGGGRLFPGGAPATHLSQPNEDTQVNPTTDSKYTDKLLKKEIFTAISEVLLRYIIAVNKSGRTNIQAYRPFEDWPGGHSTAITGNRWI